MKSLDLGQVKSILFKDYVIIPIAKEFLIVNQNNPIIFKAEIALNGKLVLTGSLSKLVSTKEVLDTEM